MPLDVVARVKAYHAALNRFDLDGAEEMFAPGAEYHSPSVGVLIGRDAIFRAMRKYFAEYPDQIAIGENYTVAAPGKVRSDWHLTATAKSTGEKIARQGVEVVTIDHWGRITLIEVEDR